LELLKISRERIDKLRRKLPKLRGEIKDELKKKGLSDELISLVLSGHVDEFMILHKIYDKDANLIGKMVVLWRSEFSRKMKKTLEEVTEVLSERVYERILEKVRSGKLDASSVREVLVKLMEGESFEDAVRVEKVDDDFLEREIRKIVRAKPGLRPNAYMGIVMTELRGKIDAKRAMEILKRIVK